MVGTDSRIKHLAFRSQVFFNQLRIGLIGFSLALFGQPVLPLDFFGAVLLPLVAVPLDFAADGAFVAVKLFGDFGDGAVAGQVLDMVSFVSDQLCVAHGNLSCRKVVFKCESAVV